MNPINIEAPSQDLEISKKPLTSAATHTSKGELLVTGVATGVVATAIIQTGKGVVSSLSRHPFIMFGFGVAAGYLTYKYRKELISIGSKSAKHSKDFILKQQENLKDLIAEAQEDVT